MAFFFVGLAGFTMPGTSQMWMQNTATGLYAAASSSGSIFFALNFGDEGRVTLDASSKKKNRTDDLAFRYRPHHFLGLESMYYSRDPTNIYDGALVLGFLGSSKVTIRID